MTSGQPGHSFFSSAREQGPVRVRGADGESAHRNHNGTQTLALDEMDILKSDTLL